MNGQAHIEKNHPMGNIVLRKEPTSYALSQHHFINEYEYNVNQLLDADIPSKPRRYKSMTTLTHAPPSLKRYTSAKQITSPFENMQRHSSLKGESRFLRRWPSQKDIPVIHITRASPVKPRLSPIIDNTKLSPYYSTFMESPHAAYNSTLRNQSNMRDSKPTKKQHVHQKKPQRKLRNV